VKTKACVNDFLMGNPRRSEAYLFSGPGALACLLGGREHVFSPDSLSPRGDEEVFMIILILPIKQRK
jgi:hypothetical protein